MALCPFATKRLIPPGANDPRITAIGAVLHVDAGNAASLYAYFNGPSGGIESHFHIRKDGLIEQYRDTGYEADANYQGNSFVRDGKRLGLISIETQGFERGEWTSAQLAAIKRLLTWAADVHHFPLRVCPGWDKPGVGYHVMFGAPGPWTPVAKTCPGPDRVKQFYNVIVPWLAGAEEDEMPLNSDDLAKIRKVVQDELARSYIHDGPPKTTVSTRHGGRYGFLAAVRAGEANAKAGAILEAVKAIPGVDGDALAAKVAEAVERLDAETVAGQLQVTVRPED